MKTILATAYAVNPYRGSEDGMGWNYIQQIAKHQYVIAITRKNNQEAIDKYCREVGSAAIKNITFIYHDLPYWMRFWKKKGRGALLYFWMWQRSIPWLVRKLQFKFDITHNLNFHNDWTPSYLWKLEKPFVWGPIGHHPRIPKQFLKPYQFKYLVKENLTWMIKNYFWRHSSALRNTVKHADFIWCMNSSVEKVLKLGQGQFWNKPSVACERAISRHRKKGFHLLSVGRLVPLKGFDLTLKAFAEFIYGLPMEQRNDCLLRIVGSGPEQATYQRIAEELNLSSHVTFTPWMDRKELMELYSQSTAFIFPSHEGAGMVVPEALAHGLPIICLQNCGPGEFIDASCGIAVKIQSPSKTIKGLSDAIASLYFDSALQDNLRAGAVAQHRKYFSWQVRGQQLKSIYQKLIP